MSAQETALQFKPTVVAMASNFRKKMKVSKDGVIELPEDLYESTLADAGLEASVVKKVQQHNAEVVCALTLATGETAIEAMKKNAKLDTVTAEMKAIRDEMSVVMHRTREVTNPAKAGEKIVQHGPTTIRYQVKGTANSGELKRVRQHLMTQAAALLKD